MPDISFNFRFFPGKTNENIFQNIQKTLFWCHFGSLFIKFGQKWIFLNKKSLSFLFKYSNYILSCKKLEKTNEPFLRKTLNWLTDGQRDNGDFVRPSVGRGSNNTMFIFYVLKINWFPGQSLKMIPNLKNSP